MASVIFSREKCGFYLRAAFIQENMVFVLLFLLNPSIEIRLEGVSIRFIYKVYL